MKRKILSVMLVAIMLFTSLFALTGCGGENSKGGESSGSAESNENRNGSIEFDYSKINTTSENIGKNVDVQVVKNEEIKPKAYEGVTFSGNTGDLNESSVKADNTNWVILAEDDKNYMLTTVKSTEDTFRLEGADGYNNGVQAANAYCAKYYSVEVNGKKYVARSINMDDIEAYYKDKTDTWKQETLGFEGYNKNGIKATDYQYYPSIYAMENGSGMNGKLDVNETPDGYEPYNNSYKSDGTSTENYLNTYYYANKDDMKDNFTNSKAYDIIFESGRSYWVATRYVSFYDSKMSSYEVQKGARYTPNSAKFGIRLISGGALTTSPLIGSNSGIDVHRYLEPARPVVVVPKSEISL
ncbi:MAG: hypothetical protein J6J36_05155 [Clostridia bacterium]|nr:hypothetical protein [Clostridia bacterium]